jgi:succinylglutamate desuccinylase
VWIIALLNQYAHHFCYKSNIKIRDQDLKVKIFHGRAHAGTGQWTTEIYDFPISAAIFGNITKALKMDLPRRKIRHDKQLISILSQAIPSVQVISVQKQRELHVWPSEDKDGATIELSQVSMFLSTFN